MGQARQRGTAEQRRADAIKKMEERYSLRKASIEEIRQELGLDDTAELQGYVVHLPATDEFLNTFHRDGDTTFKSIAKTPDLALVFADIDEAIVAAEAFDYKALVCLFFDLGHQYVVTPVAGNRHA